MQVWLQLAMLIILENSLPFKVLGESIKYGRSWVFKGEKKDTGFLIYFVIVIRLDKFVFHF